MMESEKQNTEAQHESGAWLMKEQDRLTDMTKSIDALILKQLEENPFESIVDTQDRDYILNPIKLDRIISNDDSFSLYLEVDASLRAQEASL